MPKEDQIVDELAEALEPILRGQTTALDPDRPGPTSLSRIVAVQLADLGFGKRTIEPS